MDTSATGSAKKRPVSPSTEATCKDRKIDIKRPKVETPNIELHMPLREVRDTEPMIPLPPFHQTPGPVTVSQTYLRRLIVERWEAEVKACEK
ncbi:hypothetical protein EV424DRAFT_1540896 [Suillus variegatus]|nr:hypothetical protein EV424DRAFT_1540896 [Suillus variegatus]